MDHVALLFEFRWPDDAKNQLAVANVLILPI